MVLQLPECGLRAFNDYDLVLLVRFLVDEVPLRAAMLRLARELGFRRPGRRDTPPGRGPSTIFWYELREGHRVLLGDQAAFAALAVRSGASAAGEATRLLTNRGLALLWARLDLDAAGRRPKHDGRRRRFIVNATHKAVMAMGDAVLLQAGQYHLSYPERVRRLTQAGIPFAAGGPAARAGAPAPGEFRRAHAAATHFKLFPEIPSDTAAQLLEWWVTVRDWHERTLGWVESLRLGTPLEDWSEYPARLAWESLREGLRHPRGYLRDRRFTPDLNGWSRHWLIGSGLSRPPSILLYGSPASRQALAGPPAPGSAGRSVTPGGRAFGRPRRPTSPSRTLAPGLITARAGVASLMMSVQRSVRAFTRDGFR